MTPGAPETPDPGQDERRAIALRLLEVFPEVRDEVLDLESSYEIAGAVALHARELIRAGTVVEEPRIQALFAIHNEVAARPSVNAQELVAWGVMEVLQDFAEVEAVAMARLTSLAERCGPRSRGSGTALPPDPDPSSGLPQTSYPACSLRAVARSQPANVLAAVLTRTPRGGLTSQ